MAACGFPRLAVSCPGLGAETVRRGTAVSWQRGPGPGREGTVRAGDAQRGVAPARRGVPLSRVQRPPRALSRQTSPRALSRQTSPRALSRQTSPRALPEPGEGAARSAATKRGLRQTAA